MECLIGAAYTRKAQAAGLTGEDDPSMGRVQARFADWRIGTASHWAQLWIDRNFALDYTLKSLEKILDGQPYHQVRDLRRAVKTAGFRLLGDLIDAAASTDPGPGQAGDLSNQYAALAARFFAELRAELGIALRPVSDSLPDRHRSLLRREHSRWAESTTWRLINAADPCGT